MSRSAKPIESSRLGAPRRQTEGAIERERELLQCVVEAAGVCVERLGLEGTTMDDIALESGISRATLYRKFGSKEAILIELVMARSEPFESRGLQALMEPGDLATRVERAMSRGVMDAPHQRWLEDVFTHTVPSMGYSIFNMTYRKRTQAVLQLVLQSGDVRPGLDLDAMVDWVMREMVFLISKRPWDEARLREHIRQFVLPVLIPDRLRGPDVG